MHGDPFGLYRDLAVGQRGAHNAYLDLGRFAVASASPELFFERTGDQVLLRPMKGTARRGLNLREDEALAHRLRSSSKEQAENVMIVDLLRNDVARVAETGSVTVPALFTVERYETVLQLTSDVSARLRPGTGLVELFRALFPCGSVTGAPKASSMEVIASLEPTPRGVYCGAIGLVGPPSARVRARFSVAIRTAVVDTATGDAVYGTGGGITWDSEPAAEHAEVLAKAAVLSARPRDFELLETMRYEPHRGLRNRDRHLRRLAESAEHLGFRFDMPCAWRLCGRGSPVATRRVCGCGWGAPERWPSTWKRYPRLRRSPSPSRSTTNRSTRSSGGSTTRRPSGNRTTVAVCGGPTSTTSSWSTHAGSSRRSREPHLR